MASILGRCSTFASHRVLFSSPHRNLRIRAIKDDIVYQGHYGSFTIDEVDKREVFLYRTGLSFCASALVLGTAISFLPDPPTVIYNPLCVLGGTGFGLSLSQVHMYVGSIKRTVQGLWAVGMFGALYIALSQSGSLPEAVVENPSYVWLVGPFFASMTGLAIKEGLCYGKLEAALLTFLIPTIMLGHLTQSISMDTLHYSLAGFAALFGTLAARKYTQPIKDDIGDKSVFKFQSLSEEDQTKILMEKEGVTVD
eukprot:g4952.t1